MERVKKRTIKTVSRKALAAFKRKLVLRGEIKIHGGF